MWSFKLKLVLWFALLALLPLAVAFYGYDTLAHRSETRRVDAVLEAAVRSAVGGYATRLDAASTRAAQIAADPRLQAGLRRHDWNTLSGLVAGLPATEVRAPGFHTGYGAVARSGLDRDREGSRPKRARHGHRPRSDRRPPAARARRGTLARRPPRRGARRSHHRR